MKGTEPSRWPIPPSPPAAVLGAPLFTQSGYLVTLFFWHIEPSAALPGKLDVKLARAILKKKKKGSGEGMSWELETGGPGSSLHHAYFLTAILGKSLPSLNLSFLLYHRDNDVYM